MQQQEQHQQQAKQIEIGAFTVRQHNKDCYAEKAGTIVGPFRLNEFDEANVRASLIMLGMI